MPKETSRRLAPLAALVLTLATVLILTPRAAASNGDWTTEPTTLTENVREISLAHDGERLGMAYRFAGSNNAVGFSVRAAGPSPGTWTQQSATAIAAAEVDSGIHLLNTGSAKWAIIAFSATANAWESYTTIDDGVTWSSAHTIGGSIQWLDAAIIAPPNKIGVAVCKTDQSVDYAHSTDGGASWSAFVRIDDNVGGPSSTATGSIGCSTTNGRVALTGGGDGQAYVVWSLNTQDWFVQSKSGSDVFWTVPFYNGGACPSGCGSVDGAATPLQYAYAGNTGGKHQFQFPQNNDLVTLFRNLAGACNPGTTPNTLNFNAAYLGNSPTDSNGACNTYSPAGSFQPVTTSSCAAYDASATDRIAGNSAHAFIAGMGHSTLCSGVGFEIDLKTGLAGTWSSTFTDPSQTNVFDVDMTSTKSYAAFVDTTAGGPVKIVWANTPTAAPTVANASATVTGLVGFDVDPTGGTAIARTANGATVSVWSGQTLGSPIASVATQCNRDSGVAAFTLNVAYLLCNSSAAPTDFIIKSNSLGTPARPSQCDSAHPLYTGSTDFLLDSTEAMDREIKTFQLLSVDFTQAEQDGSGGLNQCRVRFGFGASTTDGQVGVIVGDSLNLPAGSSASDPREARSAFQQYDPTGGVVDEICAAIPVTVPGQSTTAFIFAGDSQATTKIYGWNRDTQNPSVNLAESVAGVFAQARGIGCGKGDHGLVITATQVAALNITTQAQAWAPKTLTAVPPLRGVAESYDGKWGAYVDGSDVAIVNMTTGATPCTVPLIAGTFKELRLTEKAQNLYQASSTTIERWDIHACTTSTTKGEGSFDDGCGPTQPAQCPGVGGSSTQTGTASNPCTLGCDDPVNPPTSAEIGFRGLLMVLMATVMGLTGFGFIGSTAARLTFNPTLAGIGAGLLLAISTAFAYHIGWLQGWHVFLIVFCVLCSGALVVVFLRRGTGA